MQTTESRRSFLKKATVAGGLSLAAFPAASLWASHWDLAGVDDVKATLKYEASGGYISCHYRKISNDAFNISFTGSGSHTSVELLMPHGRIIHSISNNNTPVTDFTIKEVEDSRDAVFAIDKPGVNNLEVRFG
jgi:hypothetical protein